MTHQHVQHMQEVLNNVKYPTVNDMKPHFLQVRPSFNTILPHSAPRPRKGAVNLPSIVKQGHIKLKQNCQDLLLVKSSYEPQAMHLTFN